MIIITICVQARLYNLKNLLNVIFPFALIVISVSSFVFCFTVIPVSIFGDSASHFSRSSQYYNGFIYQSVRGYCTIYEHDNLEQYTKEINGEKHLVIPDEINGLSIFQISIFVPDGIHVVCLPRLQTDEDFDLQTHYSINITKTSTLKAIYCHESDYVSLGYYNLKNGHSVSSGDKTYIPIYFSSNIPQGTDSFFANIKQGYYPYN